MNKRWIILFLIVASQLTWLGVNYARRAQGLESSLRIVLACETVDPRDFFRGDYLNLRFHETENVDWRKLGVSLTLDDDAVASMAGEFLSARNGWLADVAWASWNREPPFPDRAPGAMPIGEGIGQAELASFWKRDGSIWRLERLEKQGSPEDCARSGEMRIPGVRPNVCVRYGPDRNDCLSLDILLPGMGRWPGFRFYVPEKTGEIGSIWNEHYPALPLNEYVRLSVELALPADGRCIPVKLYINGLPYDEAVERIRAGSFELVREAPAEEGQQDD